MGIRRFFDKTIVIYRLKTVSGNRKAMSTTATVDCAFQELDRQARTELGLTQDRAWIAYFDIEEQHNVVMGDHVVLSGTNYEVIETTIKNYGINQHVEAILLEFKDK